jgi:hypothetical protein
VTTGYKLGLQRTYHTWPFHDSNQQEVREFSISTTKSVATGWILSSEKKSICISNSVSSSFYDAFPLTRLYSVDDMVINE